MGAQCHSQCHCFCIALDLSILLGDVMRGVGARNDAAGGLLPPRLLRLVMCKGGRQHHVMPVTCIQDSTSAQGGRVIPIHPWLVHEATTRARFRICCMLPHTALRHCVAFRCQRVQLPWQECDIRLLQVAHTSCCRTSNCY